MNLHARRMLRLSLLAVLCFLVADRISHLSSRFNTETQYVRETLGNSKQGLPREMDTEEHSEEKSGTNTDDDTDVLSEDTDLTAEETDLAHSNSDTQKTHSDVLKYVDDNRNELLGNRGENRESSRYSKSNEGSQRIRNNALDAHPKQKSAVPKKGKSVVELWKKLSRSVEYQKSDKSSFSSTSIDLSSPKQGFYRRIRDYVSENKTFPWHLVDREYLLQNSGIEEYSKTKCVKGNPFEPLPDYKSPCWMQRTANMSVELDKVSPNGVNYTIPVKRQSNTTVDRLACMPSIFLAGFPKCGTSDLFTSLTSHHQILPGNDKELDYWTKHKTRDFEEYIQKFDQVAEAISTDRKKRDPVPTLTVDGTPSNIWRLPIHRSWETHISYIQKYIAPLSILAVQPQAKVLIITRNPTDRTISHYKHMNKHQTDKVMYQAMKQSVMELEECFETHTVRHCAYHPLYPSELNHKVQLRTGLYAAFLQDLLDLFPRDQIFIIKGEEYYHNRTEVMEKVFQFLGVDPLTDKIISHLKGNSITNEGSQKGRVLEIVDHGRWSEKTREMLDLFFEPFNVQLSKLLGDPRYLSWNKD